MRKMLLLALCLLVLFIPRAARAQAVPDAAQAWLPPGAAHLGGESTDAGATHAYQAGDVVWTLTLDGAGNALSLRSDAGSAGALGRVEAETALRRVDESALILRAEETAATARLYFVAATAAGWAELDASGSLAAAEIVFGQFLQNGVLTFAGASQALRTLRPGAQLDSMEMDEDDGFLLYEGDAYLDGQEYEFELDAYTGRLLEWERD